MWHKSMKKVNHFLPIMVDGAEKHALVYIISEETQNSGMIFRENSVKMN